MILIRAALFAVFAFMGTISLSAQSWLPPAAAIVVLQNEYDQLSQPPAPVQPGGNSFYSKQQLSDLNAKSGGCTDCTLRAVKFQFVFLTLKAIREGADTGAAVSDVRSLMISGSGGNAALLTAIQQAYDYMLTKLQ